MTTPSMAPIWDIPETVLAEIFEYLYLQERRALLSTCQFAWTLRQILEGLALTLHQHPHQGGPDSILPLFPHLVHLQQLNLECWTTDATLKLMADQDLVPLLRHISMRDSPVTDQGLASFTMGKSRVENLVSIDITYCRHVSFGITFFLRDKLEHLQLIRRQPEWMDGTYEMPTTSRSPFQAEVHTYWADGSFYFHRISLENDENSDDYAGWDSGFLFDARRVGGDSNKIVHQHLFNDLPPSDEVDVLRWYGYRPWAALQRLEDKTMDGETVTSVILFKSIDPQQDGASYPWNIDHETLHIGQSRLCDENGLIVLGATLDSERAAMPIIPRFRAHRIRVRPFVPVIPPGSLHYNLQDPKHLQSQHYTSPHMPPPELVQRNRLFWEGFVADLAARGAEWSITPAGVAQAGWSSCT